MKFITSVFFLAILFTVTACLEEKKPANDTQQNTAVSEQKVKEIQDFKIVAQGRDLEPSEKPYETSLKIRKADGGEVSYRIELALTQAEQQKGMMYRSFMPDDFGMLFVFEEPYVHGFWMKDVFLPLDLLFIAQDGRVHFIHENAVPMTRDSIRAEEPSRAVLEIPGGQAAAQGIKVGDYVLHDAFTAPQKDDENVE